MGGYLIIGDARHGKDTVAKYLNKYGGLTFKDSSMEALNIFLLDVLIEKYGKKYESKEQAYHDRVNNRKIWYDEISKYNNPDPSRLAKDIMRSSDMYVGMRRIAEINACKAIGLFDLIIGVFNPNVEREDVSSNTVDVFKHSDILLFNNEGLEEIEEKCKRLSVSLSYGRNN